MVSRGKLSHPSECLYDLALYLYAYYKLIQDKSTSSSSFVSPLLFHASMG